MKSRLFALLLLIPTAPVFAQAPQQQPPQVPPLPVTLSAEDYNKILSILVEAPAKYAFVPLSILVNAQQAAQNAKRAEVDKAKEKALVPSAPYVPPPPPPPYTHGPKDHRLPRLPVTPKK